ncbi:hypothetical protein F5884DRAFT_686874 [Xylogone sp. PMI_703]|nr:hypothetical protein F5884DRAFT_686874 [Xylogone sp. PMI_703]
MSERYTNTERNLRQKGYSPGKSPLESLPMEILIIIFDQLLSDKLNHSIGYRSNLVRSLSLASRALRPAILCAIYGHIIVLSPRGLHNILTPMVEYPRLGAAVRQIDFSHFNPVGRGRTAREHAQTLTLMWETLIRCLSLTPSLREFLAQEHVEDALDAGILRCLLYDLPKLEAVDFCACSSPSFVDAFNGIIRASPLMLPRTSSITYLGLHECTILPAYVFEIFLPQLHSLIRLDASHTRITGKALLSIAKTAQLTHLHLGRCSSLSGTQVIEFLRIHPAAQGLVYLNLTADSRSHEMFSTQDILELVSRLPGTLRSLILKGVDMRRCHIPALRLLTKQLEELAVGRHVHVADICSLLLSDKEPHLEEWPICTSHSLRYIDISDLSFGNLDLHALFLPSCPILKETSRPLEVLELNPNALAKLRRISAISDSGWCLREAGRRAWLVRDKESKGNGSGHGMSWRPGINNWGMRKIQIGQTGISGMYEYYTFRR